MRVRLPSESSSASRGAWFARTPKWAYVVGRALFGVVAPLVCFGALLAAAPDLWLWPMAIFVLPCVAAYVTSWLRAPRDDAFDAALYGAMLAATAFVGVWGVRAGLLTILIGLAVLVESADLEFIHWLAFGAAAPCGFVACVWRLRDRRSRPVRKRRTARARTAIVLVGFLSPGAVCLSLLAVLRVARTPWSAA